MSLTSVGTSPGSPGWGRGVGAETNLLTLRPPHVHRGGRPPRANTTAYTTIRSVFLKTFQTVQLNLPIALTVFLSDSLG